MRRLKSLLNTFLTGVLVAVIGLLIIGLLVEGVTLLYIHANVLQIILGILAILWSLESFCIVGGFAKELFNDK